MADENKPDKTEQERKRPKRHGITIINIERCKGCGFCVAFCPAGNLKLGEKKVFQVRFKGGYSALQLV